MFLDNEVVGVAVEFFEGEGGGVSGVDLVDCGGEGGPYFGGGLWVDLARSLAEVLIGYW